MLSLLAFLDNNIQHVIRVRRQYYKIIVSNPDRRKTDLLLSIPTKYWYFTLTTIMLLMPNAEAMHKINKYETYFITTEQYFSVILHLVSAKN